MSPRLECLANITLAVVIALGLSWAAAVWPHCAGVCS